MINELNIKLIEQQNEIIKLKNKEDHTNDNKKKIKNINLNKNIIKKPI